MYLNTGSFNIRCFFIRCIFMYSKNVTASIQMRFVIDLHLLRKHEIIQNQYNTFACTYQLLMGSLLISTLYWTRNSYLIYKTAHQTIQLAQLLYFHEIQFLITIYCYNFNTLYLAFSSYITGRQYFRSTFTSQSVTYQQQF